MFVYQYSSIVCQAKEKFPHSIFLTYQLFHLVDFFVEQPKRRMLCVHIRICGHRGHLVWAGLRIGGTSGDNGGIRQIHNSSVDYTVRSSVGYREVTL